jgi:hypothetical protein
MNDKRYHRIKYMIGALFATGFVIILFAFFQRSSFTNDWRIFESEERVILSPDEPITQLFVATDNNLSQIKILLKNEDILPGEKLTLSIMDESCTNQIRTGTLLKPTRSPKQYNFYTFDPIADSQGKTYCLSVLFQAEKKRKDGPSITITEKTGDPNDHFENRKKNKVYSEQSLIFHPSYKKSSLSETSSELTRRMSAYKAEFLKNGWLGIIILGFLVTTLLLGVILILL